MDKWIWVSTTDSLAMLQFLLSSGRLSRRKARLLAAASCRRIWQLLTDLRSRAAVEAAERLADEEEDAPLSGAILTASSSFLVVQDEAAYWSRQAAALAADADSLEQVLYCANKAAALARSRNLSGERNSQMEQGRAASCALIRDLFGPSPLRPLTIPRSLLLWSHGIVRRLAEEAYEKRQMPSGQLDNGLLGVLGDALEEAGAAPELTAHLREPGPHYRGCHVVDALTGRG